MSDSDDCLICYEKIDYEYVYPDNDILMRKCHLSCIKKWYKSSNRGIYSQDRVNSLIIHNNINNDETIIDLNENYQLIDEYDNNNDNNICSRNFSCFFLTIFCVLILVILGNTLIHYCSKFSPSSNIVVVFGLNTFFIAMLCLIISNRTND